MDATLYTGTGATLSITNAGSFKPDFIWTKCRSNVVDNCLVDAVRGGNKILYSNLTNAEDTASFIDSFNTGGYTINSGAGGGGNTNTRTYVGWQWQAGQGSTSSNTSGSITSTVSVNTTAGFSIIKWTGTGATGTMGHGLGVAPKFMILKDTTNAYNWYVYTTATGSNIRLEGLNTTAASTSAPSEFTTTSSLITNIPSSASLNTSGAQMLIYAWAEIAGFSKFGSYTGNGSTDGPFVYCGFRPKYIMYKRTDATQSWILMDTSRSPSNVEDKFLGANFADSEYTGTILDMLSNGFKVREAGTQTNASGGTYIFMAFAENPFKNANAR